MREVKDLLRQLAEFQPNDALVLSIYLDMSPQVTGENPAYRIADVVLKDRFREIEKTLLPRGEALDNFRLDAERVQRFLNEHAESWLQGVAIFACNKGGLFETVETGVPFENQVTLEPHPNLYQLARLIDEQETWVVALVDTNSTRLFVTRRGFLEEHTGPDDDPFGYGKRKAGGINQKRYHRRANNKRKEFANEAAAAIERLVEHEEAKRIILAGDQIAVPLLHKALSPQLEPLIQENIRLDIRTPQHEVMSEIEPIIEQEEEEESHSIADRLIEAVQAQGLGVIGPEETRKVLEFGQGDMLVIAEDAPIDEGTRNELVRLAVLTDATVETVRGHEALLSMGGVGAILRYQASWVPVMQGQRRNTASGNP